MTSGRGHRPDPTPWYAPRPRCPGPPVVPMSSSRYFDRIAIALSALCIVHCLAATLLMALLPIAAIAFGDEGHFHTLMLWLVIPSSAIGFYLGYREHARAGIGMLGALGMIILTAAALWGHAQWLPWAEAGVSLLGSLVLVGAHWKNFQVVRRVHVHHAH